MNVMIRAVQDSIRQSEASNFERISISLTRYAGVQFVVEIWIGNMDFIWTYSNNWTYDVSAQRAIQWAVTLAHHRSDAAT
jgi:hypothetical protein